MPDLAVVLISKNQEWNIQRLLDSVLRETEGISTEVVLVDSASTDQTTELASQYPISVLKLHPDQHLCAAAGRYVGYTHTTADLVLFVDGDMILYPGWLHKGLREMQAHADVAVVTGLQIYLYDRVQDPDPAQVDKPHTNEVKDVSHGGGVALYRRAVLEQVGTFNPYIYSDEEPELCIRIRYAGYRVREIEYPVVYHYHDPEWAVKSLVARWNRNLYLGTGQAIRYHLDQPTLITYLKERGYGCVPALALVGGLASLGWATYTRRWVLVQLWVLLMVLGLAAYTARQPSLNRTVAGLVNRFLSMGGIVRGFLRAAPPPESYPARLDIIKWTEPR